MINRTEKQFESDIEDYLLNYGGYYKGSMTYYNKKYALDLSRLIAFISNTQPKLWALFQAANGSKAEEKFAMRFQEVVSRRGLISVLRDGVDDVCLRGKRIKVAYFKPASALNTELMELYNKNILDCTRQFYYSESNRNSVDMVLLLNGIPVVALELKNQQTGQDYTDSIRQWREDRSAKELLFRFDSRILVYFAVDHYNVYMTTELNGEKTSFIPFNQGGNGAGVVGGAGNPSCDTGYATSYLWEKFLSRETLLQILQKYISRQKTKDFVLNTKTKRLMDIESERIIFPRYHQYDVVEMLVDDVYREGSGKNYLIQHSAGSGKSNSIAWLVYRLSVLHNERDKGIFNSVIVVTDRRVLNTQLQDTISSFTHERGQIVEVKDGDPSDKLSQAIADGVPIIICTLFRFSVIFKDGKLSEQKGKKFAIVIDEAHSSQNGESAQNLKAVLADTTAAEEEYEADPDDDYDALDEELLRQGQHDNLSFFAFTATPKPKTLEKFGRREEDGSFHPHHVYSMKQAIEEGFIFDVLKFYTTIKNSYEIINNSGLNPEVEELPAIKVIKDFQHSDEKTIEMKTAVIVEKFRSLTLTKMKDQDGVSHAKAMVVTASRKNAVQYYKAIKKYTEEKGYEDIMPLVAFSGKIKIGEDELTESKINQISEEQLRYYFASDMYNTLVVADKYQTGFDEPQLHTMFVDKKLKGVKAVQTLSRLNRKCNRFGKVDTYVLDFVNTAEDIKKAFEPFYTDTVMEEGINANKIYDMKGELEAYHLIDDAMVDRFAEEYNSLMKNSKKRGNMGILTSIIKPTVERYNALPVEQRDSYRKLLRGFTRFYAYITQIIRMFDKELHKFYIYAEWTLRQLPKSAREKWVINLSILQNTLMETFSGEIIIEGGEKFKPQEVRSSSAGKQMELLDVIIFNINEAFGGDVGEGGRTIVKLIYEKIACDPDGRIAKMVNDNDEEMFTKSIFPSYFSETASECYTSEADAYARLFQDGEFFKEVMAQIAHALYLKFKK